MRGTRWRRARASPPRRRRPLRRVRAPRRLRARPRSCDLFLHSARQARSHAPTRVLLDSWGFSWLEVRSSRYERNTLLPPSSASSSTSCCRLLDDVSAGGCARPQLRGFWLVPALGLASRLRRPPPPRRPRPALRCHLQARQGRANERPRPHMTVLMNTTTGRARARHWIL